MNLYAKGKVLKQEGEMATIQLSNEELGRAVLNYVVNNADGAIGERFMQNLFAGKPMTLNELLMSNVVEAKKLSDIEESSLKKNDRIESIQEKVELTEVEKTTNSCNVNLSSNFEKVALLKEHGSVQVRILDIQESCTGVYERVVKTKNGISSQIIANCDIVFTFGENNVTYSFISYKKGNSNVITPNNNLVFIWDDATNEELDELVSLI